MGDAHALAALDTISHSNTAFTVDLYKVLGNEPGNLFFSPLSIQVVLALVYFGAKGNTAKELQRGLHLPSDKMVTGNEINALMHRLNESENVLLDIANKIYLLHDFEIKKEFRQTADRFLAGVEQLSFGDVEQSRKTINDWIEDKTHGRIKDIIGKDKLVFMVLKCKLFCQESENVLLDIANKIYLLHDFEIKKEFRQTADRFLAGVEQLSFGDVEQSRKTINDWIEDKTHGRIKDIIGKDTLDAYTLMVVVNAIYFKGEWHRVFSEDTTKPAPFHLPSGTTEDVDMMFIEDYFSYADVNELNSQALMLPYKLGMGSMFDAGKANLSGIGDRHLVVSKVIHKAFIEVNEKGTEAAAATVLVGGGLGGFPPIVFKADHPYMFLIVDDATKTVLFAGRLASPSM
ncbi:serpin B8-like [Schistocerca nitens]|uniref:serpin B8-like n=1 Tax=Schistocerca nitens TaxID=7011 RepID=UPI0021182BDF|nr:serpin B8-like [Schistocerca nitens]